MKYGINIKIEETLYYLKQGKVRAIPSFNIEQYSQKNMNCPALLRKKCHWRSLPPVVLNFVRETVEVTLDQSDQLERKIVVKEAKIILGRSLNPGLKVPPDQSSQLLQQAVIKIETVLGRSLI